MNTKNKVSDSGNVQQVIIQTAPKTRKTKAPTRKQEPEDTTIRKIVIGIIVAVISAFIIAELFPSDQPDNTPPTENHQPQTGKGANKSDEFNRRRNNQ